MVGFKELFARVQSSFKFSRQELSGIVVAILVLGFVFSFRDWGEEQFELLTGLKHLLTAFIIIAISLFFKISCQKIYSLGQGQSSEFNVWWGGLVADLIIIFITAGLVPLALAGGIVSSFMVKQRLGEFRYGFSMQTLAKTALWGISANLLLALFFAIGAYFYPQNYFFAKGLIFNLVLAFCSLLPIPQQDGLSLFFGYRTYYFAAIILVLLSAVLLLTKTAGGLIAAIIIAAIIAIVYLLITSER